MSFSDLPTEIVHEILRQADPGTFYVCLQTLKLFRGPALASTTLLQEQINRLPGPGLPSAISSDAGALLREFERRAVLHLNCGVPRLADLHIWRTFNGVDRNKSKIMLKQDGTVNPPMLAGKPTNRASLFLAEVCNDPTSINIYGLVFSPEKGRVPKIEEIISPETLPSHICSKEDGADYDVLTISQVFAQNSTQFSIRNPRIAVLYGPRQEPLETNSVVSQKLVFYVLHPLLGPHPFDHHEIDRKASEEVVALAVNKDRWPIVLYRYLDQEQGQLMHDFRKYQKSQQTSGSGQQMTASSLTKHFEVSISDIYIGSVHQFLYAYPWTFAMPHWRGSCGFTSNTRSIYRTGGPPSVRKSQNAIRNSSHLGRAFAMHHVCNVKHAKRNNGLPKCVNTALHFVISNEERKIFQGSTARHCRIGAFVFKATDYSMPHGCVPIDPDVYEPNVTFICVAKLLSFPDVREDHLPPMGLKLALSPGGTRIAVAAGDTVKLWALDPWAFLDPAIGGEQTNPGDDEQGYAYFKECGWGYYGAERVKNGLVQLEAVILPAMDVGVVYQLEFFTENELWGWTETGLCRWRVGNGCLRRRGLSELG